MTLSRWHTRWRAGPSWCWESAASTPTPAARNPGDLVPRAAGPFNYPTEIVKGQSGSIYVADGYRNSRIHKFTADGDLVNSWGTPGSSEPGEFHLPHSLMVDSDERVYVCDRTNRRVQIFDSDGEFITQWTGMGGPNDIVQGGDGLFYICEQEADGNPPYVSIRDSEGEVLARWGIRHAHGLWVDSQGRHLSRLDDQSQRGQVRARLTSP